MDPFYSNSSGFNASHRSAPPNQHLSVSNPNSQLANNAASVSVPHSMSAGQAAAGGQAGLSSSYPYNPQANATSNAQYMAAASVAGGRPMQAVQAPYGGQQPVPQMQQPSRASTFQGQQQVYARARGAMASPSPASAAYGVPNPLGAGGAPAPGGVGGGAMPSMPSAPPTGASKTDLLRSMYQSRRQVQKQQQQGGHSVQRGGQVQGIQTNYHAGMRQPAQGGQRPAAPAYGGVAGGQTNNMQQQQSAYRQSMAQSSAVQAQQGMQQVQNSYQQQPSPQMTSHQMSVQQQQQQKRHMTSQSLHRSQQQVVQQHQQVSQQAYQQHQSSRVNMPQYNPQQQQQNLGHSSQSQHAHQHQPSTGHSHQSHSSSHTSSSSQQKSSSSQKQRFHLTPAAKNALREAVLSAIRHPEGEVEAGCLQRAMAQGLPKQAILNAAQVARERDRRNREERRRQQQQQQQQHGMQQRQGHGQHPHQQPSPIVTSQQQAQQRQQQQGSVVHQPRQNAYATAPGTATYPTQTSNAVQYNQGQAYNQTQQYGQSYSQPQPYGQTQQQYSQPQQQQYSQPQQQQYQSQQKSSVYQQQAQQQLQSTQQQQMHQQQSREAADYQRRVEEAKQAQQRKLQEAAKKKQLELQYQKEKQRRKIADQKRRAEEERKRKEAAALKAAALKAAAAEAAKKKAKLVARVKPWGRTSFALVVAPGARGLAPLQQSGSSYAPSPSKAVLKQSTWGGTQLCHDEEPSLVGALQRHRKRKEGMPSAVEMDGSGKVKAAADAIRKRLLLQLPKADLMKKDTRSPTPEEFRQRRMAAITAKLLSQTNIDQLKRIKIQPKRESKFLDRHIRRARQMTADAHTKRHKELLKAIVTHQSEFYKYHRLRKNDAAKLARLIRDQHKKAEVAKEKEADAAEKARIAALRANDMSAYTSLLEDTKNERLKYLLDKTDECMNQISTLLSSRVAEEEEDIKVTGAEATFTEDVTGSSYYEMAHVKSEQVRQPSILVGGELKEYQLSGLQWLVSLYNNRLNGILADEMGLGKTIQTISLIAYLIEVKQNLGPYLVIVPLSTLSNWVNEFAKWLPAAAVVTYKGTPQQRKQLYRDEVADGHFNVLLTTYEFVIRDKGSLRKILWQYAIVDEGHRMKNNQSKFAVTLGTQYNTRRRVLLTGTPLQNSLPELWALLNFLLPDIFNSAETFDQWFNKPFATFGKTSSSTGDNADDSSNELLSNEERMLIIHRLHELLRPFMLRRVKSEVLDQLPEKVEKVIRCELSSWQKELYKQISHKIAGEAATKNFNRGLNNVVMQLRKVANHPYLFSKDGYHINEDIIRTSGKVELLDRMLPKLKAAGHRILMFTQMTKMMPILEDYFAFRGFSSLRLDGSTTADEREKRMYMFNAPDSPYFIFLLSTRAGGLGLNLATADTVIIFDSDWNPMMDLQAQDRAHRIGQRKDVRVFRIITQTPVEEKILSRATEKLQMNELVVEAGKFDKSGQEKEDNSLERLKMMELLLTDFDQKQSSQGAATSEEDFDKDTDDGEEEDNKDLLNEMISSNDDDFKLYCKMDLQRTNAPTLYSDVKDCPDWILYPNGKPEEGSEVVDDGHPETLGKRRAAAGDKVYDDGLTEKQFCRMMDKQALDEEKGKKKRKKKRSRNAVDPSLILEEDGIGRKRAKTKQLEIDNTSKRFNAASSASASGNGEVSAAMNDRLISITRSLIYFKDKSTKRKLSEIFLEKPCPQTYPDYYQVIDKPIGINDILRKCRAKLYATLNDFRDDWNTLFKNALTYNGEGSWIVIDAEALRVELDRLLDKNALSMNAAESKKPVRIKLSLKKSKKKKESNVSEDVSQTESTPPTAAASMKSSESQSELSKSLHSSDESDSNADSNSFIVGMEEREASMQNRSKGRSRGIGSKGGGTRLVRRSR